MCGAALARNFKHLDWLQQVWFAGNHSDAAGVIERDRVSLSGGQDLAFVALVPRCGSSGTGRGRSVTMPGVD
ncbi:hypothetical protein NK6_2275 [Bradyrhizobium diazoefficiens]|uniref:Uncharacterized protein n=1 Tax=Bradyrhizobium diazoefficiens TaxID=1355477 RepID=A0A0E4FS80_9BRAD|nr:hypothetical protein NK6_2275 [Bradyrhizobium diazoefficiens]